MQGEYQILDAGGVELLLQACEALDRVQSCRQRISEDGEATRVNGAIREHPLMKIELGNRAFVVRTLARLGLDVEAVKSRGRPPGFS